jgi:diaminopimelate decarboxylase
MKPRPSPPHTSAAAEESFGHSPAAINGWRRRTQAALDRGAQTPFYLFSPDSVVERTHAIESLDFGLPTTCWYSFKTQPLPPLIRHWVGLERPIEVVSEFELRAALASDCPPERLLINGPAKHRWLTRFPIPGLRVNFDSLTEIPPLLPMASELGWRTGIRVRTSEEFDPENPSFPTQFGMEPEELPTALHQFRNAGREPETIHTHLRTNVSDPTCWTRALDVLRQCCEVNQWHPGNIDLGGGLPAFTARTRAGKPYAASFDPSLKSYAEHVRNALRPFTWAKALWLEHGRHTCAESGVLAVRILDIKQKGPHRLLICDGGRTLHALVSIWEDHPLLPLRASTAPSTPAAVHGPTCMAFDQLGRRQLPSDVNIGDVLLWLDAGAYHLPWETRFSHGLCEVWWDVGEDRPTCERRAESFTEFWTRWQAPPEAFGGEETRPLRQEIHLDGDGSKGVH